MGGLGGDNMSIIIICCLHGKPWQDLVDKCKRIHSEKKATSKLCEPAFSAFDRFTSDGPFAEVSVLKAASDELSNANETSSSSHTSSPSSSSPISTEEKFEIPEASQVTSTTTTTNNETNEDVNEEKEEEPIKEEILPTKCQSDVEDKKVEVVKEIENGKADESTVTASSEETVVVSNGD